MRTKSKDIGTRAESAVVKWLQRNGWPEARRLPLTGALDGGDIDLGRMAGAVLQIKAGRAAERASDNQVAAWVRQAEGQALNSGAQVGLLVTKRAGYGLERVEHWWAHYRLGLLPARSCLKHLALILPEVEGN